MQKTLKQAVKDFNENPKTGGAALREHVGDDPVLMQLPSGKVDYAETVEAIEYYGDNRVAAPGAKRLSELLESARPAREFDVLRGVALFKGKAPARPGADEPVVDWNPVPPIWRETVAYAAEFGKLPQGADSETVAAELSSASPEVPWPRLRKEWEALVASTKPADAAKVARVRGRMAGEVAAGIIPFADDAPRSISASNGGVVIGGDVRNSVIVTSAARRTTKVHLCYLLDDAPVMRRLREHMAVMEKNGLVSISSVEDGMPGESWQAALDRKEAQADVILVGVSPSLLATSAPSRMAALARAGKRIIPVILSPCAWEETELVRYNPVPPGNPVSKWAVRDDALFEVTAALRRIV